MYEVTVEASFAAAHRLREYEGACERLHGDNYRVVVAIRAETVDSTGMVVDFKIFKGALREVIGILDHRCLNDDIPDFGEGALNPTAENMAEYLLNTIAPRWLTEPLVCTRVVVRETPNCWAEVRKET